MPKVMINNEKEVYISFDKQQKEPLPQDTFPCITSLGFGNFKFRFNRKSLVTLSPMELGRLQVYLQSNATGIVRGTKNKTGFIKDEPSSYIAIRVGRTMLGNPAISFHRMFLLGKQWKVKTTTISLNEKQVSNLLADIQYLTGGM